MTQPMTMKGLVCLTKRIKTPTTMPLKLTAILLALLQTLSVTCYLVLYG